MIKYRVEHTFREIHTASSAVQRINDTQDSPAGDREDVSSMLRLYHRELRDPAIGVANLETRKTLNGRIKLFFISVYSYLKQTCKEMY